VKVEDIQKSLGFHVAAGAKGLSREVAGGYSGDLLSDVMANAKKGALWLTIQSHPNIVAVAVLRELAGIILANGRDPDEETKAKADDEGIPLLLSRLSSFELAGRLYGLGIGRAQE
jgi:predicted transcriptional regulator